MFGHALWRSLVLVALGIFLRSIGRPMTYFTFEDTLTQIGLGYPFLFLLGFARPRGHGSRSAPILFGYWLRLGALSAAAPGLQLRSRGRAGRTGHTTSPASPRTGTRTRTSGWRSTMVPQPFPARTPFVFNSGGYLTLSFIPTLGTMILGLVAGRWLRESAPRDSDARSLLRAGAIGIASGWSLHFTGICPVVKRIWTPSWTLFSGGICFLFLAGVPAGSWT